MLKTCLCAGVQFVLDVDLAVRRRIIHGLKTHPLRQQFTVSGPEPARLWLSRYHKADEAGLVFERQVGFNFGLTLDDVGHISIGMDAIHECLLDLFSLVLMQSNIGTVKVPRILPELKIFEPSRWLPDCTWPQFITVFTKTEHLYDNPVRQLCTPTETRIFQISPWLLTSRSLHPMTSPNPRLAPAPFLSVPSRSRSLLKVIKARTGTRIKACSFRSDVRNASSLEVESNH